MSRRALKRRRGRPPLPPAARRTERIHLRVPPAFAARLREQAHARHLTLSRFLLVALQRRELPPLPPTRLDFEVVGQLARIGNNLNQAVHLLHTGRLDPTFATALAELRSELSSLRRLLLGLPPAGSS